MRKLLYLLLVGAALAMLTAQINNGGGGGSGTISAGTTNQVPKYTASTTIGNSSLDDGGTTANTLTYVGTSGIQSTSANSFTAGLSATTAGCYFAFGASGAATKICAVGNGTEWDATFATLHLPAAGTYGVASGNATYTSGNTTILASAGGSWQISSTGGNLVAATGKGQHINTQAAGNDIAGTCTLSSGTCTVTFTTAYTSAPVCVAVPSTTGTFTTGATLKVAPSTTTVVLSSTTGTDTAVIDYHCLGNPN